MLIVPTVMLFPPLLSTPKVLRRSAIPRKVSSELTYQSLRKNL
jgi:hypothetical protein